KRHLSLFVWHLVLAKKNVEIAIAIDISHRNRLRIFQVRLHRPDLPWWIGEATIRGPFVKKKPFEFRAEEIDRAVARKIAERSGKDQARIMLTQHARLPVVIPTLPINPIRRGEDNFTRRIMIQIPHHEGVDKIRTFLRLHRITENLPKWGRSFARPN